MVSFRVMMVHLVSLVVLESLVDLVPKVNKTLTSHLFMTNPILRLFPSTDSCVLQVSLEIATDILEVQELKASRECPDTQVRLTTL